MLENLTIIIMGGTGDLTKTKLIPAVYELIRQKKVEKLALIGAAFSDETIEMVLEEGKKNIVHFEEDAWNKLKAVASGCKLDFYKPEDYAVLKSHIEEVETKEGLPGNRIFYLATLPQHFDVIHHNLADQKMVKSGHGWQRIIYEKPFGTDLASAKALNKCIGTCISEKDAYRADHYLGKEIVGSIPLLRFTNRILEPLWSRRDIDSVEIILDEDFGIKNRGAYYDAYGAVKDILQSHVLQVLALLAIESPMKINGEYIRTQKAKILKATRIDDIILGQYEGYQSEPDVKTSSQTETFFAAKLSVRNNRWKGVPFYVRAGKNLSQKRSVVHIRFKSVDCLLAKTCPSDNNYLTLDITPTEGFSFEVNSKMMGRSFEIEPIQLSYMHEMSANADYTNLLEQAIIGEPSFFASKDEIEYAWKIVDGITKGKIVFPYTKGSRGPKEFEAWSAKYGIVWKS